MATETPAEPRLDTAGGTYYHHVGQSGAEGRAVSARDGHHRNPPLIPGWAPLFAILHPIAIVKHFLCKLHRLFLLIIGVLATGGLHSQIPDDFNPGANSNIYPLAVQEDGKILVGRYFSTPVGQPINPIVRLNADGSLDPGFNPEANGYVNSLAVQADGKILMGGDFTTLEGQPRNRFARLSNDPATSNLVVSGSSRIDWLRGGSAPEVAQVTFWNWNGSAWMNLGYATRVSGGWRMTGLSLPAGGWIRASGRTSGGVFNGGSGIVAQVASHGDGPFPDIAVTAGEGAPLVSGTGTLDFGTVIWPEVSAARSITITNAGDGPLSGLAVSITGEHAADFTSGSLATTRLAPGESTTLQVGFTSPRGAGLRGAELSITSNDADESPFRINLQGNLAHADPSFNPGADRGVSCLVLQADGKILAGGYFTMLGGQPRSGIARLNADGSLDPGFNPGAAGYVYALAVQTDERIIVGGYFTMFGGQPRNHLARLNADGSLDPSFNPGADRHVESLALEANGKILVGGEFTTLGGQPRNYLARLNADGSLDPGFNPGANYFVQSFAVQADGKILVGGPFTTLGGQPRNYMARLDADGSPDSGYPPGANGAVPSFAMQADGKILVGGNFTTLGGQPRSYIGRLNNDPATSNLVVSGSDRIDWVRGGSAPEVEQVIFENWNGSAWVGLGNATRVSGGWRMTGLSLPPGGWIRASGRTSGGTYNGSSGIVTQTTFPLAPFAGYTVGTPYQTPAVISSRKLLTKTSAPNGSTITVTAAGPASANGGAVLLLTDSIRYTPPNGFSGADTFAITLSEASGASVTGTVTVNVGPAPNAGGIGRNPPVITPLPDGKVGISFQGIPGRTYLVQRSVNDLEHWETLATLTADDAGKVTFSDDNPPPGSAFYRLGLP